MSLAGQKCQQQAGIPPLCPAAAAGDWQSLPEQSLVWNKFLQYFSQAVRYLKDLRYRQDIISGTDRTSLLTAMVRAGPCARLRQRTQQVTLPEAQNRLFPPPEIIQKPPPQSRSSTRHSWHCNTAGSRAPMPSSRKDSLFL